MRSISPSVTSGPPSLCMCVQVLAKLIEHYLSQSRTDMTFLVGTRSVTSLSHTGEARRSISQSSQSSQMGRHVDVRQGTMM